VSLADHPNKPAPNIDTNLPLAILPRRSAFVFGHEEFGVSFQRTRYPEMKSIMIPQLGRVQRLNVSIAASILMYEYLRQHGAECKVHGP